MTSGSTASSTGTGSTSSSTATSSSSSGSTGTGSTGTGSTATGSMSTGSSATSSMGTGSSTTMSTTMGLMCSPLYQNGMKPEDSDSTECDYPKDNVSTAEYQTKIAMPSSATSPFDVVITFDADTTIGSCHSNCGSIDCEGATCSITYTGTIPMELFNVKKVGATQFDDWSNIISVTVNG